MAQTNLNHIDPIYGHGVNGYTVNISVNDLHKLQMMLTYVHCQIRERFHTDEEYKNAMPHNAAVLRFVENLCSSTIGSPCNDSDAEFELFLPM